MATLPTTPGFAAMRPFLVDYGGVQRSPLGGKGQRVNRMGNRFGIECTLPPLTAAQAMAWIGALNAGVSEGALMIMPQPGFTVGSHGACQVNGAGQAGRSLAIDGGTAGYQFKAGQFFNVPSGGNLLYQVAANTTLNGSGAATLPLTTELRVSPPDNLGIYVTDPLIEGFIEGDGMGWEITAAAHYGLSFTLIEY